MSLGGNSNERIKGEFGIPGAIDAGKNMTAQMIGKAVYNFYPLGEKLIVLIIDSKSVSSWTLNPFDGDEVNKARSNHGIISPSGNKEPKTTTYQTYLFMLDNYKSLVK
ncbi:hypothetical protein G5B10_08230 [Fluviicola sp. SGL-29]|nr:hypothetical protein [Fluviicola sp. SGL-29]